MTAETIAQLCVGVEAPIRQAIRVLDQGRCGIVLVLDSAGRLVGTITDGDIRRAILAQQDMDVPVGRYLPRSQATSHYVRPVTADVGTDVESLLSLMQEQSVRQIPLLDHDGRVVDLAILDHLLPPQAPPMRAVIMAGGRGTRLLPLTEDLPKPMLPVGGRPLLEHIIEQLQQAGIRHVNVSTHYKPEKITEYFGDGKAFGVDLHYVNEASPLGTGGVLGLMAPPQETQLVINGDILTQMDFRAMLQFHQDNAAELTVAVRRYEVNIPYGVIDCEGPRVTGLTEKPTVGLLVNAGVYLLEPSVYEVIPSGQSFNMTDLIRWLLELGRPVISFPIREYWMDVGEHRDYAQAQDDADKGRVRS